MHAWLISEATCKVFWYEPSSTYIVCVCEPTGIHKNHLNEHPKQMFKNVCCSHRIQCEAEEVKYLPISVVS